ncbi:hypothetical protein ACIQH6_24990 [Micromonospora orduensis]|uniref:hypothetical protein n=1 Tax=Micromonospora orduensis TaxID=1420891 RepID=UPI0037F94421
MADDEKPDEITVILRILDIIDRRLAVPNNLPSGDSRQQILQIFDSFVEVRNDVDEYTVGQAGAVGRYARADNNTFQQVWRSASADIDVAKLSEELKMLRGHLRMEAETPEQDEAVAEINKAQAAASDGDGPRALEHLQKAGKWALAAATTIGTTVAAAAIKSSLGMQ